MNAAVNEAMNRNQSGKANETNNSQQAIGPNADVWHCYPRKSQPQQSLPTRGAEESVANEALVMAQQPMAGRDLEDGGVW